MRSMNMIIVLLMSVERLSKTLKFRGSMFISTTAHTDMHITSVTAVDKLLYSFLVVVSAIINEALVLKALKCFDG